MCIMLTYKTLSIAQLRVSDIVSGKIFRYAFLMFDKLGFRTEFTLSIIEIASIKIQVGDLEKEKGKGNDSGYDYFLTLN